MNAYVNRHTAEIARHLRNYPHHSDKHIAKRHGGPPRLIALCRFLYHGATPVSTLAHDDIVWFLHLAASWNGFDSESEYVVGRGFGRCDLVVMHSDLDPWLAIEVKKTSPRSEGPIGLRKALDQVTRYGTGLDAIPVLTWPRAERAVIDGVEIMSPTDLHLLFRRMGQAVSA